MIYKKIGLLLISSMMGLSAYGLDSLNQSLPITSNRLSTSTTTTSLSPVGSAIEARTGVIINTLPNQIADGVLRGTKLLGEKTEPIINTPNSDDKSALIELKTENSVEKPKANAQLPVKKRIDELKLAK